MVNTTNSQVIITTHSPYILTSLNILLYSEKVENHLKNNTGVIIPKNMRIAYSNFAAYKVENNSNINTIESLLDEESHMISTDYIDKVSFITNSELDELLNMETGYDL